MAGSTSLSDYSQNLPHKAQDRYLQKISCINNFDPYSFGTEDFNISLDDLPEISSMEILIYLAVSNRFYTGDQIRAYKSLDAVKYYEAGLVINIKCAKKMDNFIVLSEVKHPQRMNAENSRPWLILNPEGIILHAHCKCMAGLTEVCSHVAALAFAIHFKDLSCTEKSCSWFCNVSKPQKSIQFKPAADINFGRSPARKSYNKKQEIIPLAGEELINFLHKVNEFVPDAPILRVIEPFASMKVPKASQD